ncbi:ATP-binding protein [Thermodesulfobacterium thermophilum]|uniref:ATP-binding protein n=1 Tax=Thermodesulfobacterium thermophilum TaxID=886 RepID=UPI00041E31ED|nr:4Fe-4S binding protein [Thermodesulfobacterium thermophilum]
MKASKIIEIDEELCNGCGQCVIACHEGAIAIVNGKAKLVAEEVCDGLGACIGECPTGAIKLIEKKSQPFPFLPCGCPSHQVKEFIPKNQPTVANEIPSALSHWPVKLRLVPPSAKFLKGANLLICADCVAVAYPQLHTHLLPGKKILTGCPKFDPPELYWEKLSEILHQAQPNGLEIAIMEVPCCKNLVKLFLDVRKTLSQKLPFKVYTIGIDGSLKDIEEV